MKVGTPLLVLILACTLSGCSGGPYASGSKSSPAQFGAGLRGTAPITTLGPASISAVGSYEYSKWDGGHDDVFSGGIQLRGRPVGSGLILGGEAIYHGWICKSDAEAGCGDSPAANGLGLHGLILKPLPGDRIRLWAAAGPKWLTDFESDGELAFESGFGWHAQVGAEFALGSR